jgi:hypothetical protein
MQHLSILCSLSKTGNYQPLAGQFSPTIRKFTGKYQGLMVGDNVVARHTDAPEGHEALVTELLRVSAIAIGPLDVILSVYAFFDDPAEVKQRIYDHYPLNEGEERNEDELYCAIYF